MLTELAWHAVGCSSTCGALVAVMLNAIDVLHRYSDYSIAGAGSD